MENRFNIYKDEFGEYREVEEEKEEPLDGFEDDEFDHTEDDDFFDEENEDDLYDSDSDYIKEKGTEEVDVDFD